MRVALLTLTVIGCAVALATGFFTPLAIAIQTGMWALSLPAVDKSQ